MGFAFGSQIDSLDFFQKIVWSWCGDILLLYIIPLCNIYAKLIMPD